MKILFWADGFWPRIGGSETQGFQFVQGMQNRGHSCLVLAQRDDPSQKENEIYKEMPIHRIDFNPIIKNLELKNIHLIKERLEWIAKEFQPDIVHLNTFAWGSAFVFLLFRNLFRAPAIATVHAPYWDVIPHLVKEICSQVDQICCVSKWVFHTMEKQAPHFKDKLKLIYNGLPMPYIVPSPLPFSPPTVLILGRISSEKGFETAIEAFYLLRKKGSHARLLIAGEGTDRPFLEHLVDHLNLRSSVQFTGALSRDGNEVPSVINQATFVVMPSHWEAFGLAALEAMQMGRPVIASDVGGLPELVSDRERGFLVPPKDPIAFCNAMETLLEHPEETERMGMRAYEWARGNCLLAENLDQYEELFNQLPKSFHETARQCNYSCL